MATPRLPPAGTRSRSPGSAAPTRPPVRASSPRRSDRTSHPSSTEHDPSRKDQHMTDTDPTPTPAPEVLGQTGDLQPVDDLWRMFVAPATQDNYSQIARDQAAVRGIDPGDVLREMADQWDQ